jgi:hypothetical protein
MSKSRDFMREHLEFKTQFEECARLAVDRESAWTADQKISELCKTYLASHPELLFIHNLGMGMLSGYERDREYDGPGEFKFLNKVRLVKTFWVVFCSSTEPHPHSLVLRKRLEQEKDSVLEVVPSN